MKKSLINFLVFDLSLRGDLQVALQNIVFALIEEVIQRAGNKMRILNLHLRDRLLKLDVTLAQTPSNRAAI